MTQKTAFYSVQFGLSGCYMPDSVYAFSFSTRRELADFVRGELEVYEMPANLFREVNIKRLWSFIQSHGSSTAHFSLEHDGHSLSFSGLTQDEFRLRECEN